MLDWISLIVIAIPLYVIADRIWIIGSCLQNIDLSLRPDEALAAKAKLRALIEKADAS
jgi:hypothetical protein